MTEYVYNSQDQVTFNYYQPMKEDSKYYSYIHDYPGRLRKVKYYTGRHDDSITDSPDLYSNFVGELL